MNISVIIPIYKVESYLRQCVDSVLAQTYDDFEVILVDDGSPDGCGTICDEYAENDARVKVIHQANGGLSAARNAGMDIASGEWITFIDSDDWVNESYLADLAAGVSRGFQIGIAETCLTDGDRNLSFVGRELTDDVSPEAVYDRCDLLAVWAWGKLFHRDLIGGLRFPVGKIQEDEFFTYQVLFKVAKVAIAHNAVYYYRQRSDSIIGRRWYPERMLALDGMKEQRAYFELHGFRIAERYVRKRMILWLCTTLLTVRGDRQIAQTVIDKLNEEFASAIADNGELLGQDPQVAYWVHTAKHPWARRVFQLQYAFRLMCKNGLRAMASRVFRRLRVV